MFHIWAVYGPHPHDGNAGVLASLGYEMDVHYYTKH